VREIGEQIAADQQRRTEKARRIPPVARFQVRRLGLDLL
jgi:hypothetical protein